MTDMGCMFNTGLESVPGPIKQQCQLTGTGLRFAALCLTAAALAVLASQLWNGGIAVADAGDLTFTTGDGAR